MGDVLGEPRSGARASATDAPGSGTSPDNPMQAMTRPTLGVIGIGRLSLHAHG
jgi:hypothetical protein